MRKHAGRYKKLTLCFAAVALLVLDIYYAHLVESCFEFRSPYFMLGATSSAVDSLSWKVPFATEYLASTCTDEEYKAFYQSLTKARDARISHAPFSVCLHMSRSLSLFTFASSVIH